MSAANTRECFRECLGKTVKGVLFDALPAGRADLARGTKTLIFDDGTGLTFASNGSFWPECKEELQRAIADKHQELLLSQAAIKKALRVAGVVLPAPKRKRA